MLCGIHKENKQICFVASSLLIYMKQGLKGLNISTIEALEQLKSCYIVNLRSGKHIIDWTKTVTLKNQQKPLLKYLGCNVKI